MSELASTAAEGTFCLCGCGGSPSPGRRYIRYHARKPRTSARHLTQDCVCGCGRTTSPGSRYIKGHQSRRPLVERVNEKTDRRAGAESCWPWLGWKNHKGYGYISVDRRHVGAHRVMYELSVGPIPDGLELDHLCGNRVCVNPAHLEPVTHMENMRRMGRSLDGYFNRPTTRRVVESALATHFAAGDPEGRIIDAGLAEVASVVVAALAIDKG